MARIVLLSVLLATAVAMTFAADLPFTAEDCGTSGKLVTFHRIDVNPKPIQFFMKTNFNVSADIKVDKKVDNSYKFNVMVKKIMGRWNIPLMSLTKSFCDFMSGKVFGQILCPLFANADGECKCPVQAGSYKHDNAVITMDLAKLPVPKLLFKLGTGNWQLEITAKDSRDRQVGCLRIRSHAKIAV